MLCVIKPFSPARRGTGTHGTHGRDAVPIFCFFHDTFMGAGSLIFKSYSPIQQAGSPLAETGLKPVLR